MKHADKIMNTQKFKDVLLSAEGIIKQYRSPDCERSIAKGIPIQLLGIFYSYSKMVLPLRIRYRGNSKQGYSRPASFCHMAYADTFAIYHR